MALLGVYQSTPEDNLVRDGHLHPLFGNSAQNGFAGKMQSYFRHKVGVNSTKIVKTSSRPSNMAAEHTQVWKSLSTP